MCGPCLRGEKVICLAITEPSAGSDVANLKTTAVKSECGKFYILNGEKKCTNKEITTGQQPRRVRKIAKFAQIAASSHFLRSSLCLLLCCRDHQRSVRRLLHCCRKDWRSRCGRRVDAAGGARSRRQDDADEVLGRVAVGHNLYYFRRCEGSRRESHRQREPGLQVHHVRAHTCIWHHERRG